MNYSVKSDRGIVRQNNEDACCISSLTPDSGYAIVCDGMGGENAGEIASGMAVSIIGDRISAGWRPDMPIASIKNLLITSVSAANVCICERAKHEAACAGMGTTVVAAVISGNSAVVAHAGDSRAYLCSGGALRQLTSDHSYVQELIKKGLIKPDEAKTHPRRSLITRALGVEELVEPDLTTVFLPEDGRLLLCTDGLTNCLTDKEIAEIILSTTVPLAAETLVARANAAGGSDNISAIVISLN